MDYLLRQQSLFERSKLNDVFPVRSFEPDSQLFWCKGDNNESFLAAAWLCAPLCGVNEQSALNLKALFSNDYPNDTMISFHLTSSTFIDPILSRFYNARSHVMSNKSDPVKADIARRYCANRVKLYQEGAKKSLDESNPLLLKDFSLICVMKIPVSKIPTEEEFDKIRTLSVSFASALMSLNCSPRQMNHEDYLAVMRQMLNPSKYPKMQLDPNLELNEQIFDYEDSIKIEKNHLEVNERFVKSMSVQRFPEVALLPQVSHLIGDPRGSLNQILEPFILSTHIYLPDYQKERDEITKKGAKLRTQAMGRFGAMFPRIRMKSENFQVLIDSIEDGNRPIKIWTNLLLSSDTKDGLIKQATKVKTFYEYNGYLLKDDTFTQGPCWQLQFPMAIVPQAQKFTHKFSSMTTEHACELIPIVADFKGNGPGANSLFYTKRGQPVMYDPYDSDTSFNGVVAGITGSGKSVLCNDLLMGLYTRNAIVRIIDSGYSYRKTTDIVGGEFIDFANDDLDISINPFTNIVDIDEQYGGIETILEYMAAPKEGLTDYQLSKLQQYVLELWQQHGNKLEVTLLSEYMAKEAEENKDIHVKHMAAQFFKYTRHGVFGKYFIGDANLQMSGDWSCLELDGLQNQPELRMIVLIMMVMKLKQDFISTDRNRYGIVLIDEFWKFCSIKKDSIVPPDPGVRKVIDFIDEAYRVFRKFNKCCWVATQSLLDLGLGSPLLNNSESIILGKQRKEAISYMKEQKMLSISDYDYKMLETLDRKGSEYSEYFIYTTNRGSGFLRFKLDRFSQLLYTSNAVEDTRIRYYESKGFTIPQAIEEFMKEQDREAQQRSA
ncbi:TraC family protein [Alteromonas sp. BZK5]|uniref:TraC family protein n=1 Tax=Alteromonas sp. BZK5 TaxID=1904459 RepID=UPI00165365E8|nr:TraC family protein [Alteromonas sp. BZK5]MBC6987740.1 TraC family protein [Alteromonas sp. BZK5]